MKITKLVKPIERLPILHDTVSIKSKKKRDVNFWHRISFKVGSQWWEDVVFIPTKEKLKHKRYSKSPPWRETTEY